MLPASAADPVLQTVLVGLVLNFAGALVAFYLWSGERRERWLLLMGVSKSVGALRWCLHYLAENDGRWRLAEGLCSQGTMLIALLACYSLLAAPPWPVRRVAVLGAALLTGVTLLAHQQGSITEAIYLVFAVTLTCCSAVMWRCYRQLRLSGYAILGTAYAYQALVVCIGLSVAGAGISNLVVVPLFYQVGVMLGFIITFYQREKRRLDASERTLEMIFDTAPSALTIVHPDSFVIERANPSARALFGEGEHALQGRTVVEAGLRAAPAALAHIDATLRAGAALSNYEMRIGDGAGPERIVAVSAAPVQLAHGGHYVFAFYDLTEQRHAEQELRASAEQIRALYLRLANVEDEERRKLHRELHDQVGANLSALLLELDLLARLQEPSACARHLASAREISKETMAMARDLMAQLRPPALDDYGLVAALRDFADLQRKRAALMVRVEGDDLHERLPSMVEVALFRIAKEAVVNVLKHAQASVVLLRVHEQAGVVTMTVSDDGRGFDVGALRHGAHWGLKNMAERAFSIAARFEIVALPGQGTTVTVTLRRSDGNGPVPAASAGSALAAALIV